MKLIKPGFQIETEIDGLKILRDLERYGRVCYKSEHKITDSTAGGFVNSIIKSGHESVIEHISVTVRIICDRGVSHEIVRHRLASYSQESTRYCNYSKGKFGEGCTFIIPNWCKAIQPGEYKNLLLLMKDFPGYTHADSYWFNSMLRAEDTYLELITLGWNPQQARSVLPNSLKTEIIVTYNLREWRHFFKLRTSRNAHPQMREIIIPLLVAFREEIPVIFDKL